MSIIQELKAMNLLTKIILKNLEISKNYDEKLKEQIKPTVRQKKLRLK